jgi:hypothetical protein
MGTIGIDAEQLRASEAEMEVLFIGCDQKLGGRSSGNDGKDGSHIRQATQDLVESLTNGQPLTWLSFKHGFFVERNLTKEVVNLIRDGQLRSLKILHGFGEGGSTMVRTILFKLRFERLCIIINDSSVLNFDERNDTAVKCCKLIENLSQSSQLPVLIFLDPRVSIDMEVATSFHEQLKSKYHGIGNLTVISCHHTVHKNDSTDNDYRTTAHSKVIELKQCDEVETDEFRKLYEKVTEEREFSFPGFENVLNNYLSGFEVDWALVEKETFNKFKDMFLSDDGVEKLIRGGLYHSEIDSLQRRIDERGKLKDGESLQPRPHTRHPLYVGLLAHLPDIIEEKAIPRLEALFMRMDAEDLKLVRLCVVLSYFAPGEVVSFKLMQIITKKTELSSDTSQLLSFVDKKGVAILLPKLACLLVKKVKNRGKPAVFREMKLHGVGYSLPDVYTFLKDFIYTSLQGSEGVEACTEMQHMLVNCMCEFRIWHGGQQITRAPVPNPKYSFIVELTDLQRGKEDASELLVQTYIAFKEHFKSLDHLSLVKMCSHTAGYLAKRFHNDGQIGVALELLRKCPRPDHLGESFSQSEIVFQEGVCYRERMKLILKNDEWNDDTMDKAVECYFESARKFEIDMRGSKEHPMSCTAWVGTTRMLLHKLKIKEFQGNSALMVQALAYGGGVGAAKHAKRVKKLEMLRNYGVVSKLFRYLAAATDSVRDKRKKGHRNIKDNKTIGHINSERRKVMEVVHPELLKGREKVLAIFANEKKKMHQGTEEKYFAQLKRVKEVLWAIEYIEQETILKNIASTTTATEEELFVHQLCMFSIELSGSNEKQTTSKQEPALCIKKWYGLMDQVESFQSKKRRQMDFLIPVAMYLELLISGDKKSEVMGHLERALEMCEKEKDNFLHSHHPKLYVTECRFIRNNPLSRFCRRDEIPYYEKVKNRKGGLTEEEVHLKYLKGGCDFLKTFKGEAWCKKIQKSKRIAIALDGHPEIEINRYEIKSTVINDLLETSGEEKTAIHFFLGIAFRGLHAFGIRLANPPMMLRNLSGDSDSSLEASQ